MKLDNLYKDHGKKNQPVMIRGRDEPPEGRVGGRAAGGKQLARLKDSGASQALAGLCRAVRGPRETA